jgi:hypothetical protein
MKPYGIKRKDRVKCSKKGCLCGDMSSKHPKHLQKNYVMSKRLKKHARQQNKKECLQ